MKYFYSLALAALLIAGNAHAQPIPNASFEAWDSQGNPEGWFTTNVPGLMVTVTQSTDHYEGAFSAQGQPKPFQAGQTFPPVLNSGSIDHQGFAINARPEALNGFLKATLAQGDVVFINVAMTKNGTAVAGGTFTTTTSSSGFQSFSLPIYYIDATVPDTAIIMVTLTNSASGSPSESSSFNIDALAFGAVLGVGDRETGQELTAVDRGNHFEISFRTEEYQTATLDLLDMHGRVVETLFSGVSQGTLINFDPSRLASGLYLCRLITPAGVITKKLSVVR
jgi:hypothetical protein